MVGAWLALAVTHALGAPPTPAPAPVSEPPPTPDEAEVVPVVTTHPVQPPCELALDRARMGGVPARSADALLSVLPGLVVTSRLGRGGAHSFRYRGLDMGHGRDLALHVEDVPLNEPSHVLSAGYLDTWLLPTLLVDGLDLCPSVTRADVGSFGTAASAHLSLAMPRSGVMGRLAGGSDGSGHATVAWSPPSWGRETFVLGEVEGGEGVGADRGWRHIRVAGGVAGSPGPVDLAAQLLVYNGLFDVPILLRASDLDTAAVRPYGGDRQWRGGGASTRVLLIGRLSRPWAWGGLKTTAWAGTRAYSLEDNLTGRLIDPTLGDGVRRTQTGVEGGLRAQLRRTFTVLGDESFIAGGVDLVGRFFGQQLGDVSLDGEPAVPEVARRVAQADLGAWAQGRVGLFGRGELVAGVRAERVDLSVRPSPDADPLRASAWVVAPRASVLARPASGTTLHLGFARGYRPPDARLVVADGPLPMQLVDTLEGGADARVSKTVRLAASGFGSWARGEVLLDPLDFRVLDVGNVRRWGVEARVIARPLRWLEVVADAAWSNGRVQPSGTRVPYGPATTASVRVAVVDVAAGPVRLDAATRVGVVAPSRLPDGSAARTQAVVDLASQLRWRKVFFDLGVDNVVPWGSRDVDVIRPSTWDASARPDPVPARHVLVTEPFSIRLGVGLWL